MSESAYSEDVVVYLSCETVERIEAELDYGDSMSGWVRDAIQDKLDD